MIQQLQKVFHSVTKSLEVLYVVEGVKSCARILVFENNIKKVIEFLSQKKIFVVISDFKVIKQNIQSEFYSDKSIKVDKNSAQKGYFFVYLSKDKKIAEKAKFCEGNNEHKSLGLLLGYPECCCDFFAKNFNEKNTDLTLKTLEASNGYEFSLYTNIAARHFDISLLSHFPHSFDCYQSIEIAKSNLKIINKHSKEIAAMFLNILQSVAIYTMEEGIFLFRKHKKIGDRIIYSDILTTTKNKLYFLLSSNKELKIINKNNFLIKDANIKGKEYGIMVFN